MFCLKDRSGRRDVELFFTFGGPYINAGVFLVRRTAMRTIVFGILSGKTIARGPPSSITQLRKRVVRRRLFCSWRTQKAYFKANCRILMSLAARICPKNW